MADLGLLLEDRPHQLREAGVDRLDLLELVEYHGDAAVLARRQLGRQLE